ncbi:MAG: metal ion transporter, metal ion family protein [Cyanobacteria bacterium RYN_339]|nr:metal ion transporter, metal ion family protein [Cyanobacteria bacterium RYN_339]
MSTQIADEPGWRRRRETASLPEVFSTVKIPGGPWWRRLMGFLGPGYMVAVGYMDPGNWATDLAGGSQFAYTLLSVVLISNLMAIVLQALSAKLGIVTGRDLAQACADHYGKYTNYLLWVLCELAIAACDLAEVIGSAIALQLLFGLPLLAGVLLTTADVLLVLLLQNRGFRLLEILVITLIASIAGCFAVEIFMAKPVWSDVLAGFVPRPEVVTNPAMLYVAIGILGATVMPHNLYLHSAIVQTRAFERTPEGKREAIKWATVDSTFALMFALFINAAILILAAATFHVAGKHDVGEIQQAYQLLSPMLGAPIASTLFAVALLASGQNSTLTGTLAGQIVMEGFLSIKLPAWGRRLLTRGVAIAPAVAVIALYGERSTGQLLILSQVVLSLQLSFAIFPLVRFTSDPAKMGEFVNAAWLRYTAYTVAFLIAGLNVWLLIQTFRGMIAG